MGRPRPDRSFSHTRPESIRSIRRYNHRRCCRWDPLDFPSCAQPSVIPSAAPGAQPTSSPIPRGPLISSQTRAWTAAASRTLRTPPFYFRRQLWFQPSVALLPLLAALDRPGPLRHRLTLPATLRLPFLRPSLRLLHSPGPLRPPRILPTPLHLRQLRHNLGPLRPLPPISAWPAPPAPSLSPAVGLYPTHRISSLEPSLCPLRHLFSS